MRADGAAAVVVPRMRRGRTSSLRSVRTLAALLLFASISLLRDDAPRGGLAVVSSNATAASHDDGDFSLCGRTLLRSEMPHVPSDSNVKYGVARWERDVARAVVLDHRPEKIHGRTGNQVRGFLHAFDCARDRGGPLVIHDDGFPLDSTLRKLYLGLDDPGELEERLGVIMYDNVDEADREGMYLLGTRWARDYVSEDERYTQFDTMQHRHYLLQQLYRMTAREMERRPDSAGAMEMCASYRHFFGDGSRGDDGSGGGGVDRPKYATIHSRSFEGKRFLEEAHRHYGVDSRAMLDYPPDLVSSILAPLGMANSTILMITDGQNPDVVDRLSSDPVIGPHFSVVPDDVSNMAGDILLGMLSDVFVGNPASSFSQYIAMARYALGLGPSYLYVRRHPLRGTWEAFCDDESCFYQLHDLEARTHQPAAKKTIP